MTPKGVMKHSKIMMGILLCSVFSSSGFLKGVYGQVVRKKMCHCNFIIILKLEYKQDNANALPRWPCWGLIANSSLSIRTRNWLLKGKNMLRSRWLLLCLQYFADAQTFLVILWNSRGVLSRKDSEQVSIFLCKMGKKGRPSYQDSE